MNCGFVEVCVKNRKAKYKEKEEGWEQEDTKAIQYFKARRQKKAAGAFAGGWRGVALG